MNLQKSFKSSISLYIIFFCGNTVFSQSFNSNTKYELESGTYLSTSKQTPFGLRVNQYGITPLESQILTIRGAIHKEYDSTTTKQKLKKAFFSYGYGLNTVINVGQKNQILLPEAYIKIRCKAFELYCGRRKEIFGLVDSSLTSGSYIWSGNALPMPKIQISIPNYISIFGMGIISIKGGFAHGWFDNGIVQNSYLHQKWFYGKIGKTSWKVKLYAGFNHQVQWGGHPIKPYIEAQSGKLITHFGNDLKTYLNVVTGISLNKNGAGNDFRGVPLNEAWNRAGNHLGSVDIAAEFSFKNHDLLIYRQSIYEDGSLFYLNNITDGLFGISIKRKNVSKGIVKANFEYLNTTSQGGATGSGNTIPQLRGQDTYFNNSIYLNGWTYCGNIIGTPLITPLSQINKKLIEKYNFGDVPSSFNVNSRVQALSISMNSKFHKITSNTQFIYSYNLGLYGYSQSARQFSFLQQINYQLQKFIWVSSLSIDNGKLFNNNLGLYVGIRRTFI